MKNLKPLLTTVSILGAAALALQTSSAQPTGSITYAAQGPTNVLWDLSLLAQELQNLNLSIHKSSNGDTTTVEVQYSDPFTQDGKGKLKGQGTTQVMLDVDGDQVSPNPFEGKYATSGSITSSKGVARATFTSRVTGSTTFSGDTRPRTVSAMVNYNVKLDAVNNQISGRSVMQGSAAGKGAISETKALDSTITFADLMSELGDGTWTLALNFNAAIGNKLSGTATLTPNKGQVYPFTFTGIYTPRTAQSKLNLKGVDAGKGSTLQVTIQGSQNPTVTKIVGQVSGQLVNIKQ